MELSLGDHLVNIALEWQVKFGVVLQKTTPISEYDVAMLEGLAESECLLYMQKQTAVSKESDFIYNGIRNQIKVSAIFHNMRQVAYYRYL